MEILQPVVLAGLRAKALCGEEAFLMQAFGDFCCDKRHSLPAAIERADDLSLDESFSNLKAA